MNNELQHHGIPGMKWGKRRFQNYDGTLTDLGKRLKREVSDRYTFSQVKKGYQSPTNFGSDYRDRSRGSGSNTHLYDSGRMAPIGADFQNRQEYGQYRRAINSTQFRNPDTDRRLRNITATNRAFNSFYDVKDNYQAPTNFGKTHSDFVSGHRELYSGKTHVNGMLVDRKVAMEPPTSIASTSQIKNRAERGGGRWLTDFDRSLEGQRFEAGRAERKAATQRERLQHRIESTYGYKQAAKQIGNAAKQRVNSFVTAARMDAGRDFTDQLLADAERMRNSF